MFDTYTTDDLLASIESSWCAEARGVARRMRVIAELLWRRTEEAEDVPGNDDPGYALITGFVRASAEVGAALNLAPEAASRMVGHAEVLDTRLPRVAALLAAGHIDWLTAKLIITRTELVDGDLVGRVDHQIAERISTWQCWSRRRIVNTVDKAVATIDPEAAKERRVAADNARYFEVTAQPNGMARLRAALPAPIAVIVDKRVTELAATVCKKDPRTTAQRKADAFAMLGVSSTLPCQCGLPECPARTTEPAPDGGRFVINVIASSQTVEGNGDEPGYLEGYGVIDAGQVRQLAESATLRLLSEPVVTDAEAVRYQPSAALDRWVRCRDLTCCWPGCNRSAWQSDIDHTIPFDHARPTAGGPTAPWNAKSYCRHHHLLKTFHSGPRGWRDEQLPDGTVVLTSPTGRAYRVGPAGADLFPELGRPCVQPVARRRSRVVEKRRRTAWERRRLRALRPVNAEQRGINRARAREIELRQWRNDMRRTLLILEGGQPSSSPWCSWINDPPRGTGNQRRLVACARTAGADEWRCAAVLTCSRQSFTPARWASPSGARRVAARAS